MEQQQQPAQVPVYPTSNLSSPLSMPDMEIPTDVATSPSSSNNWGKVKKIVSIFFIALIVLLLIPTGLVLASQNSIPGDSMYPVKRDLESAILVAASVSPYTRAYFRTDFANRRSTETTTLLDKNDRSAASQTFEELLQGNNLAIQDIKQVSSDDQKKQLALQMIKNLGQFNKKLAQINSSENLAQNTNQNSQQNSPQNPQDNNASVQPTPTPVRAIITQPGGTSANPTPTPISSQEAATPTQAAPTPTPVASRVATPTPTSTQHATPTPAPPTPTPTPAPSGGGGGTDCHLKPVDQWQQCILDQQITACLAAYTTYTYDQCSQLVNNVNQNSSASRDVGAGGGLHFQTKAGGAGATVPAADTVQDTPTVAPQLSPTSVPTTVPTPTSGPIVDNQRPHGYEVYPEAPASTCTANSGTIVGWACDPDAPNTPIHVDIHVDGQEAGEIFANNTMFNGPDLQGICGGLNHGFSMDISSSTINLRDGAPHKVTAYGHNIDSSGHEIPGPTPNTYDYNLQLSAISNTQTLADKTITLTCSQ